MTVASAQRNSPRSPSPWREGEGGVWPRKVEEVSPMAEKRTLTVQRVISGDPEVGSGRAVMVLVFDNGEQVSYPIEPAFENQRQLRRLSYACR